MSGVILVILGVLLVVENHLLWGRYAVHICPKPQVPQDAVLVKVLFELLLGVHNCRHQHLVHPKDPEVVLGLLQQMVLEPAVEVVIKPFLYLTPLCQGMPVQKACLELLALVAASGNTVSQQTASIENTRHCPVCTKVY